MRKIMMRKNIRLLLAVITALFLPSLLWNFSLLASDQDKQQREEVIGDVAPNVGYRSASGRHKIQLSDSSLAQEIESQGGRVVADYGDYKLMEVDDEMALSLSKRREVEVRDEYNLVMLNAGIIDTSDGDFKGEKESDENFRGKRMRLVQFVGPVKPEWYDELVKTGVRIVTYIPNNTYLVYGDRRSLRRLRAMASRGTVVQWEGRYKEEFKLDPSINAPSEKGDLQVQNVNDMFGIQLIEDKEENPVTLALIEQLKLEPIINQWDILNYKNYVVRISPDEVYSQLVKRVDIISIAPYVTPSMRDERQNQIIAGNLTGNQPTPGDWLSYLAGKGFSQAQFTTSGFVVDVGDDGLDNATTLPNHPGLYVSGSTANASRVVYARKEGVSSGPEIRGCEGHGTLNSHIIGGYVAAAFGSGFPHADAAGFRYGMGVAPFVKLGSSVVFSPGFTFPNFANWQSRAYNDGARVSSNSWGANTAGGYNLDAQSFDALVRDAQPAVSSIPSAGNQEMVIIFASGNAGPTNGSVGAPGTAKNVITVGGAENVHSHSTANGGTTATGQDGCGTTDTGADNANDMIGFSSRGPCLDGRRKPDIVAPATHVTGGAFQASGPLPANGLANACFNANSVCALPGAGNNFFPVGQQWYTTSSGTSHSTPAVAGGAALVRQHFINQSLAPPSPALTKATLMNSARYLTGVGANDTLWSNSQGMGEMNLNSFFDIFVTPSILRDQSSADTFTATGQTRIITGNVSDSTKPLRITLAYTDAPGPTTGNAFINNLDLEVTVGGNTFKGNVFSGAFSATGGSADTRNNVESVLIPAGITGSFIITIKATNIAGDGVPNFGGLLDQDFALVVYNAVEAALPVVTADAATVTAESCSPANGSLDPGEAVTVNFAIKNIGTANTSNLVATLVPGGGVNAPSGPQNYGALIAGGPAVSKPFSFSVSANCGETVTATLQLQDGPSSLGTVTFTFTIGTLTINSVTANYGSGNLAVPLPDLATVEIPITVPDVGVVSDVNVRVRLNHTFDGDVDMFLVGPDGTIVELSTDNGSTGDNYGSGANDCSGNFTVFDDAATNLITGGTAPFVGTFRPELPLSAFNGRPSNGTWKLRFIDDANVDTGTIGCVQLEISRRRFRCCGVVSPPEISPAPPAVVTAESCSPGNGACDPDETVTVNFPLKNVGLGDSTNLVATLVPGGGVNAPSGPQNYGAVIADGPVVTRPFSFVVSGTCGGVVTATLQLQDGSTNLGTVTFTLKIGGTAIVTSGPFANPGSIIIPAVGTGATAGSPSAPYPSPIAVSGITGTVNKVTVTLTNFNHTFPGDVDVLLVGPGGQKMILMSDAGGSVDAVNATLTFNDAAPPIGATIVSGTFSPTNISTGDTFPAPAPAAPFGSALSVFNGVSPNGTWSLYVVDDANLDAGSIAGGWSLTITTSDPVCCTSPCLLTCPANITVSNDPGQCGAIVNYTIPPINGSCGVVTSSPASGAFFPVGTTTVTVTATKQDNTTTTCTFTVTVKDMEAPVITGETVNPSLLGPPNHQMVNITVNYNKADNCTPSSGITSALSVTSNEPINGTGDGDMSPDWQIVNANQVRLRAERAGGGTGRIYTITITCTDAAGNSSTKNVTVSVPHNP